MLEPEAFHQYQKPMAPHTRKISMRIKEIKSASDLRRVVGTAAGMIRRESGFVLAGAAGILDSFTTGGAGDAGAIGCGGTGGIGGITGDAGGTGRGGVFSTGAATIF